MESIDVVTQLAENRAELERIRKEQSETQATLRDMREMMAAYFHPPSIPTNTNPSTASSFPPTPSSTSHTAAPDEPRDSEKKVQPPTPARRELFRDNNIPSLSSPVTASQHTVNVLPGVRQEATLPPLAELPVSFSDNHHVGEKERRSTAQALQKGMLKPPHFEGNTGEKAESISTWWKQVGNYARTFDECDRAVIIKSYLRGPAALWLDSQEREIGRDLTVQELADGLTQEYGSETTSDAALQRLKTLSMATKGCSTLQEYNASFNREYNKCSAKHQSIAVHQYVFGLHPEYLKLILQSGDGYATLAQAKAAATKAAAKRDQIIIAEQNFSLQSQNMSRFDSSAGRWPPAKGTQRWDSEVQVGKVNLNAFSALADMVSPGEDEETDHHSPGSPEGQVAALTYVGPVSSPASNKPPSATTLKRYQLSKEQVEMLRRENRCFRCYKANHMKRECRSKAATSAPQPLK